MDQLELLQKDLTSGDDDRAEAAALEIGKLGDAALPVIHDLLSSSSADERWWATRTLAVLNSEQSIKLLIEQCGDPDLDVRACAILALGELGERSAPAVSTLIERMTQANVYEGMLAADALARIGKAATMQLVQALKEGTAAVRGRAARALSVIADPRSIPALIAALDDESAIVEHYANDVLPRLGVGSILLEV